MSYVARCLICGEAKPIVDEDAVDNSRYGPCGSAMCDRLRSYEMPEVPVFKIGRLRAQNEAHVTGREIEREIVSSAKEDGREIERAPK